MYVAPAHEHSTKMKVLITMQTSSSRLSTLLIVYEKFHLKILKQK